MTDVFQPDERSRIMSLIQGKNTKPERIVRSIVHRLGYRFRLHRRDLPGTPDLVLPKLRSVIFVHGCFWHMHSCHKGRRTPVTNRKFWQEKRSANASRDRRAVRRLRRAGWRVLVVWECQLRDVDAIAKKLQMFLRSGKPPKDSDRK